MDVFSFPIAGHVRSKLLASKYIMLQDFRGFSTENLSSETGLSIKDATELLAILGANNESRTVHPYPSLTAAELLDRGKKNPPISTSSKNLDKMLGGGIPLFRLTEICGTPGSGKTQLCLQLAVNVQLSNSQDGLRGEVLYIDTEGSFSSARLADMAKAVAGAGDGSLVDEIIHGVHYRRCLDCASLLDTVNTLQDFISNHVKVRLIIIDNIAYHFRKDFHSNYKLRTRTMHNVAQILAELAHKHSLSVVITNQMTTRIDKDDQSKVVPSLGDSWGHACCNRLVLSFDSETRFAKLVKSSHRPFSKTLFQIETAGIRDVPGNTENCSSNIVVSQQGFLENSIGTSELGVDGCRDTGKDQIGRNTGSLSPVAKRPRLD